MNIDTVLKLSQNLTRLELENQQHKKLIKHQESQITNLTMQLELSQNNFQTQLVSKDEELKMERDAQKYLLNQVEQIPVLKQSHNMAEQNRLQIISLQQQLQERDSTITDLLQQVNYSKYELDKNVQQLQQQTLYLQQIQQMQQQIQQFQQEKQQMQQQTYKLEQEKSTLLNQVADLRLQLNDYLTQLKQKETQESEANQVMFQQSEVLKEFQEVQNLQSQKLNVAKSQIEDYKTQINLAQSQISRIRSENEKLSVEHLEKSNQKIEKVKDLEIGFMKEQNQLLNSEISTLIKENERLKSPIMRPKSRAFAEIEGKSYLVEGSSKPISSKIYGRLDYLASSIRGEKK